MTTGTVRKGGGQPGNHNALSHGFYSSQFSSEEHKRLRRTPADLKSEINLLRVFVDRLAENLSSDRTNFDDANLKKVRTMAEVCLVIGGLKRGQLAQLSKDSTVERAIETALRGQQKEWVKA